MGQEILGLVGVYLNRPCIRGGLGEQAHARESQYAPCYGLAVASNGRIWAIRLVFIDLLQDCKGVTEKAGGQSVPMHWVYPGHHHIRLGCDSGAFLNRDCHLRSVDWNGYVNVMDTWPFKVVVTRMIRSIGIGGTVEGDSQANVAGIRGM